MEKHFLRCFFNLPKIRRLEMKKRFLLRIVWILLLVSILFSHCCTLFSQAHDENSLSSAYLSKIGNADYHLRYRTEQGNSYTIVSIVGHFIGDTFYPAYCVNPELPGAETEPYTVDINEVYNDPAVWRVLMHGYPYQSPESMGLDMFDAYFVTKMAIYCVIGVSDIEAFNYDDGDEIGAAMLDKLYELVNEGFNGTGSMPVGTLNYSKVGDFTESGNYYYQEYKITSGIDIEFYNVYNIVGFSSGTFVANTSGASQNIFSPGEHFRVYVPKDSITDNINGKIFVSGKTRCYPILYGESNSPDLQNYVITSDPFGDEDIELNLNVSVNTGKVRVNKTDEDTACPIEGVVFGLYKDGQEIQRKETNQDGVAEFSSLMPGTYKVKEISTTDEYILSTQEFTINVKYNGTYNINATNKHKQGNIQVYKVDKDNHKVVLGGIEFDLYSEEFDRIIDRYTTDQNGEVYIPNLRTGTYQLREVKTNKWYNLSDSVTVQVIGNETTDAVVENELKKGQIKIIKVDKDDNEVKLAGVKFEVLNEDGKVLEEIVTDENGKCTTKQYPIRDYDKLYLKETETQESYHLDDEIKEIVLEENQITTITFENEVKKGQIKVIKVDKDNNEVKLAGVKFDLLDEDENIIDELITDENGEVVTDRLPISKKYILRETDTLENYALSEETPVIELKEDKIKEIQFENEKKKGQIEIIKIDSEEKKVKLEGVTFEVLDKDGNIVETLITDKDGRAETKRLPIDNEYTVREKETKKEYVLSDKIEKVVLAEDEIKTLTFENVKKKGTIKITKVSSEYSELLDLEAGSKLAGCKLVLLDENQKKIGTYTTDENGEVVIKDLLYGNYTIYEIECPEGFLLDSEPKTVFIEENEQVIEVEFKDSPEKKELPKTGVDANYYIVIIISFFVIVISKEIIFKNISK